MRTQPRQSTTLSPMARMPVVAATQARASTLRSTLPQLAMMIIVSWRVKPPYMRSQEVACQPRCSTPPRTKACSRPLTSRESRWDQAPPVGPQLSRNLRHSSCGRCWEQPGWGSPSYVDDARRTADLFTLVFPCELHRPLTNTVRTIECMPSSRRTSSTSTNPAACSDSWISARRVAVASLGGSQHVDGEQCAGNWCRAGRFQHDVANVDPAARLERLLRRGETAPDSAPENSGE